VNFSDKKYIEYLAVQLDKNKENYHSELDCFYQLIDGVEPDILDNLLKLIVENRKLIGYDELTIEESYILLQDKHIDDLYKKIFLDLAYQCIDSGLHLGNNVNEFGINKSNWISHSLQEARLCSIIASKCGLDDKKAFKLGILHDYGRKYDQGFKHVILGFEKLFDLGYYEEAIGCLTHSFLNGNFFACYAPSKNYVVDDNLNAIPVNEDIIKSDLFSFLSIYTYSDYDRILNIADLMATDSMVVPPEKRILDIEKRRKMEGKQREFFILQLSNTIYWCLNKMGINPIEVCDISFTNISELIYNEIIVPKVPKIANIDFHK